VTLRRLDRRESAELVRGAVGGDALTADVVDQVAERGDGIPLFLEELSSALVESGADASAVFAGDAARSAPVIPVTLQASLMERFDRLSAPTKEVAQVGAAIGREFSYELVAGVCGQLGDALDTALENLVSSGLAFRRGVPPNPIFVFKHGLVQDAIYSTLLRSKRQQLHARIAEAFERTFPETLEQHPELLAHHFSEAGEPKTAMRYWRIAVERALRTSAYPEAISQCVRGLHIIESIIEKDQRQGEEAWLQLQRGIALTAKLGPSAPDTCEAFSRALDIAEQLPDGNILAGAVLGLWAHHNARAHLRPALALAERLYAIGEARGEKALCVQAHAASLTVAYKMGAFEQAWQHFERGIALYRPDMKVNEAIPNYSRPGPDMLLHGSFVAWVMGYPERARNLASQTMITARKLNQPYTITHCVYMLGHLAELRDDWQAVRMANEETVELATRWGFTGTLQLVARRIALVAVAIDQDKEQFRLKCEQPQPGFARSLHNVVLARMCASLGNPERGLELIEETFNYSQETGSCFYDAEVHRTRGKLLATLGHRKEAEGSYLAGIHIAKQQGARMWQLRAATDLAWLWEEKGDRRRAIDLLSPLYSQFTEGLDEPDFLIARTALEFMST
jgi:tetratricopeptide (TPR) repeat protein